MNQVCNMNQISDISQTKSWRALQAHGEKISSTHTRDLFLADKTRFTRYSYACDPLFFDFSKNKITDETIELLLGLAETVGVSARRHDLLLADAASCHVATRDDPHQPIARAASDVLDTLSLIHI